MKRFRLEKRKFSVRCGPPPPSDSHPPFHASSSPSLSVSCALHAEMISIPAELMRFCWTEKRQGKCTHTHTNTHTHRRTQRETHTQARYPLPCFSLHSHMHTVTHWSLATFFSLFQNAVFPFKVNVQKSGPRQSWTTITHEAELEPQLNPHVAFTVPPTPFTHKTIKTLTRIRPPELGPVTIATC